MLLPVIAFNACKLDWVACVNHHSVTDINANVRNRTGRIVRAGKENQVAGLGFGFRNDCTAVIDTGRGRAFDGHCTGFVQYPAHETRAVKRGGRR